MRCIAMIYMISKRGTPRTHIPFGVLFNLFCSHGMYICNTIAISPCHLIYNVYKTLPHNVFTYAFSQYIYI